jgi:hypothetical protein
MCPLGVPTMYFESVVVSPDTSDAGETWFVKTGMFRFLDFRVDVWDLQHSRLCSRMRLA